MQWTYSVVVQSEASRNIPNAIKELTSSQENAAQTFKDVSNVLTNDFQDNLVAILDTRLREWQDSEEEGGMAQHFQQVHDNLLEVRAALVMLLDLKEGSFTNTLSALKLASDAMKETGATMEDAITKIFVDKYDMSEIEAKTIRNVRDVHGQIPSSIIDPESKTFLSMNKKGDEFQGFADKFLTGALGSWDEILQGYPDFLTTQLIVEFNRFLNGLKGEGSGKDLFKTILADDEEALKDLEIIKTSLRAYLSATNFLKEVGQSNEKDLTEDEIKEGLISATETIDILTDRFDKDSTQWDNLKEKLGQGIINSITQSNNEFLKDQNSIDMISVFIQDLLDNWEEDIRSRIFQDNRKYIPPPEGRFEALRKKAESYDPENIRDSLKQYMSQGNDPFGIYSIRDTLEEVLNKSKTEFKAAGDDVLLKDIVVKNLGDTDLSVVIKETLSAFLVDYMDDTSEDIFLEIEKMFSVVSNEMDKIIMTEKIGASLDGVLEMIESFNELPSNTQTGKIDPEVNENVTIDLESVLIDNFKEAKQHTDNWFRDGMVVGINSVLAQIEMMRTDMGFNMSQINTSIGNIKVSDQLPSTITNKNG